MRLPGVPRLFPRLYPPPDQSGRDARRHAADLAQPAFLSGPDARHAHGNFERKTVRFQGALEIFFKSKHTLFPQAFLIAKR